jgi:hypothetical protein
MVSLKKPTGEPAADHRSHFTRRFSADSLPRFGTISNVTLAPSGRPLSPAFSTAEIWTNWDQFRLTAETFKKE